MNRFAPKPRTLQDIELDLDVFLIQCTAKALAATREDALQRRYSRIAPKLVAYKLMIAKQRRAEEIASL